MDEARSYSTTKFTPWHDNICYFGVGSLCGSVITACAARYFYYHLTGTPQFVINTHKYTKILSGVLLGVGLCSVIRSYSVDSFVEAVKSTFALWDIQKNNLSFSQVKSKYLHLLNLSSFQKGYIPLLNEEIKNQDYESFIKKHTKDVDTYLKELKDTHNTRFIQEAKQSHIDELDRRLETSLDIPGYLAADKFIVLSHHSKYGQELMGKNFESSLASTLKEISWYSCFNENKKALLDLFNNKVISDVNKLILKEKFLSGLKASQTNIIETKKCFSEAIKNLPITDKELYEAATASERSKWMSGQLSYFDLRAHNDEYLANHLNPEEITKLGQELPTWSYSNLIDPKYARERTACEIDDIEKIKFFIQSFRDNYLHFCKFHGKNALRYVRKDQMMDWSKEDRELWENDKLTYLELHKTYGSDIAQCLIDYKNKVKNEMLETWSYRELTSLTYQIDRETFGIEYDDITFAIQNFKGTYFGEKGFLEFHGREAISRLDDQGRLRYTQEIMNAFATSSFEALKADCAAFGINRAEILRKKWIGKGYFQIYKEENNFKLFWSAVKAKEISVNEYNSETLKEIGEHMRCLGSTYHANYIQGLILDQPNLFITGMIKRNDIIFEGATIADLIYFFSCNSQVLESSQTILEQIEKLYNPHIWSLGLLHADDPVMQSWVAYEIKEIITKNASRERYQVCLQNNLVASPLSELLRDYDQFVQNTIELKNSDILKLEESYNDEKKEAESKNKKALSAKEEKLKKLKEDFERKKSMYEQTEERYLEMQISLTKIKDAIQIQELLISSKKDNLGKLKTEVDKSSPIRKKIEDENTQYNARKSLNEEQLDLSLIERLKAEVKTLQQDIVRIKTVKEQTDKAVADMLVIQRRIAKKESLTSKLAGLESEQKQLSIKNVIGVEDANALQDQQKAIAAQIKETVEELAKLNAFKDKPIEQITARIESMKQHKDYLNDCSTQNTRLQEIENQLLKLEPIQQKVNILTSKIQKNNQKLKKIDELSSRFTKLNEEIGSLEKGLQNLKNDQEVKLKSMREENTSRDYILRSSDTALKNYNEAETSFEKFKENQEREYQAFCKRLEQQLSAKKQEAITHYESTLLFFQKRYVQQLTGNP